MNVGLVHFRRHSTGRSRYSASGDPCRVASYHAGREGGGSAAMGKVEVCEDSQSNHVWIKIAANILGWMTGARKQKNGKLIALSPAPCGVIGSRGRHRDRRRKRYDTLLVGWMDGWMDRPTDRRGSRRPAVAEGAKPSAAHGCLLPAVIDDDSCGTIARTNPGRLHVRCLPARSDDEVVCTYE
jgi:hypothetical protein